MANVAERMQAERLKFPGMLPREIIVLKAWLALHETEYDSFDYNVRIGAGDDPGPDFTDDIRAMAIQNTQKRIDAVAFKGQEITIIEVKDRATASAIGQLVTYRALWLADHAGEAPPKMLLVCNRLGADMPVVLAHSGVEFAIVAADFGSLRRQT